MLKWVRHVLYSLCSTCISKAHLETSGHQYNVVNIKMYTALQYVDSDKEQKQRHVIISKLKTNIGFALSIYNKTSKLGYQFAFSWTIAQTKKSTVL